MKILLLISILLFILTLFGCLVALFTKMIENSEINARKVDRLYPPSRKPAKSAFLFSQSDDYDLNISRKFFYDKNERWKNKRSGSGGKKFNKFKPKFLEDDDEIELISKKINFS